MDVLNKKLKKGKNVKTIDYLLCGNNYYKITKDNREYDLILNVEIKYENNLDPTYSSDLYITIRDSIIIDFELKEVFST